MLGHPQRGLVLPYGSVYLYGFIRVGVTEVDEDSLVRAQVSGPAIKILTVDGQPMGTVVGLVRATH